MKFGRNILFSKKSTNNKKKKEHATKIKPTKITPVHPRDLSRYFSSLKNKVQKKNLCFFGKKIYERKFHLALQYHPLKKFSCSQGAQCDQLYSHESSVNR